MFYYFQLKNNMILKTKNDYSRKEAMVLLKVYIVCSLKECEVEGEIISETEFYEQVYGYKGVK